MHALLLALSACSPQDDAPSDVGATDDSGGAYPSGYTDGQYRLTALAILPPEEGKDWDGDGDADNKLPNVLQAFDLVLAGWDLSKTGLNTIMADAIQNDGLVILVDARYADKDLTLDFLTGSVDGDGSLVVDAEHSYDASGDPVSRMEGTFVSASSFVAGPDPMVMSIPIDPSGPPAPFPLEEVAMEGALGAITLDGTMFGIVPVDRFVADVAPTFVPAAGLDLNGNDEIDPSTESQEAILGLITMLLDTSADVQTEDGRPGISSAFHFAAGAANFD